MLSKRKNSSKFKELSVTYLRNSKYSNLFGLLLTTSKAAKKASACEVTRIIRSEINMLVSPKSKTVWRENTKGIDRVASFSWEKVHEEAATLCPTLLSVLTTSLSQKGSVMKKVGSKNVSVLSRLGAIIGQIVYTRKLAKMKLFQEIKGVQLWI